MELASEIENLKNTKIYKAGEEIDFTSHEDGIVVIAGHAPDFLKLVEKNARLTSEIKGQKKIIISMITIK